MLGIILGLAVLMFLAFRGWSIIWIAPICALVVAIFGGLDLLPAYTETYMGGFVGFTMSWFPVFLLGAIFGKLMEATGAAQSVAQFLVKLIGAKRAILAVVIGCAILTYGGISLFVVVFAMYPIALALFREANITRKLIPGCIALGAFTFTMTAIPGTPQIQNLIPTDHFNTTPMAAPIMGIAATIVMLVGGYLYLKWKHKKWEAKEEFFTEPDNKNLVEIDENNLPNPLLSFVPLVSVIITLNVFEWEIVPALLSGIILSILLNLNKKDKFIEAINGGASGSMGSIMNTSAAVGFGSVVQAVPGFMTLTNLMMGVQGTPLISVAVAVTVLAGATGSASGGMGIALEALGPQYMELATELGMNPAAFHRVASLASGGLDTLPHNGAVLTLLSVTGLSHKDSYIDIFITCSVIPVLAVAVAIILGTIGLV